jgi:hypothetical protein
MYQPASLQTSRGFLGLGKNWSSDWLPGAAAMGWHRLSSADIELTSSDERVLGEDDLSNDLFLLGAGVKPLAHWAFGLGLKYHRFAFNGFSESGFGADVGTQGTFGAYRFGAVLADLGGTMLSGDSIATGAGDVHDKIPARLRLGVAAKLEEPWRWPVIINLLLDETVKLQSSQETRLHTGAEIWGFHNRAAFRFGYQQHNGPTLGVGGILGKVQIDYAFLLSVNVTDEHRIGTTFRF